MVLDGCDPKDFEGQIQDCMRTFNRELNPSTLFWDSREGNLSCFQRMSELAIQVLGGISRREKSIIEALLQQRTRLETEGRLEHN